MIKKSALLLLPNLLGESQHHELFLPASVDRAVETIDGLIAESESGGRRFLKRFQTQKPAHEIPIALLNEHTADDHIDFLLEPLMKGERWGLISDAGLPCIADPGHKLIYRARQKGITVQAFNGPSSLTLALMLSGLPGQQFAFHGYLERQPDKRIAQIKRLEKRSLQEQETEIFIEAPYRNTHLLGALLETLKEETVLSVAWDLTLATQGVMTQPIRLWKKMVLPNLEKKPAIFLFNGSAGMTTTLA